MQTQRKLFADTKTDDWDETYLRGARSSGGSAVFLYDPSDAAVEALVDDLYEDTAIPTNSFELFFSTAPARSKAFTIVLESISEGMAFGAAQVRDVQFKVSGPVVRT